jgi:hypothetical protein
LDAAPASAAAATTSVASLTAAAPAESGASGPGPSTLQPPQQQQQQGEEQEQQGEEQEQQQQEQQQQQQQGQVAEAALARLRELLAEMATPYDPALPCWRLAGCGSGVYSAVQLRALVQQRRALGEPQPLLDALRAEHSQHAGLLLPLPALLAEEPLEAQSWMYQDPGSSQMFGPACVAQLARWAANMQRSWGEQAAPAGGAAPVTTADLVRYLEAAAQLQRQPACRLPIWQLLKCHIEALVQALGG